VSATVAGRSSLPGRENRRTLRVVDHIGNSGGGIKYVLQLLESLESTWDIELRAHPAAARRYRRAAAGRHITFHDEWPAKLIPAFADRFSTFRRLLTVTRQGHREWTFVARDTGLPEDVHFFPWLHRHNLSGFKGRGLGVFHDAIFFQMPELIGERRLAMEHENLRTWFEKLDVIITTSCHTRKRLLAIAGDQWSPQVEVIAVADTNELPTGPRTLTERFGTYLFMPANTSPHKNHKVLLEAMRASVGKWNLVLTGDGTQLAPGSPLQKNVNELGLSQRVFGLGYVQPELVGALIANAEALVMPTLGEGGGSFPVSEAITAGTPVITSNIDVIVEQLGRMGAEAQLFEPHDVKALVRILDDLAHNGQKYHQLAEDQRARVRVRTWSDVAREFLALLERKFPSPSQKS
jgi:glycosyltransferase involved in cell wall biosynthesis